MALRFSRPLVLAHHPLCGQFEADFYHVGRHRLCLGCFTSYTLALVILAWWWLLGLPGEWYHHLLVGFGAGSAQFASLLGFTRSRAAKVGVKVALGFGFGLATVGVLGIPVAWWWRALLLFELSWTASMLAYFRNRALEQTCRECVWHGNWTDCPGFNPPFRWREPPDQPAPEVQGLKGQESPSDPPNDASDLAD